MSAYGCGVGREPRLDRLSGQGDRGVTVPGEGAELAGNPGLVFQIQPTEHGIAQACQDTWGRASAHPRVVLPPVHITDPMDLVLDGPMQADGVQEGCGWEFRRAATAHPHDGFLPDFARFENRGRAF